MAKIPTYKLKEVFTPTLPAFHTYVEREGINYKLDSALEIPGNQVILYGSTGVGKTTLLSNKIKSGKIKCIITRCDGSNTLNDIILDAFNELNIFYTESFEKSSSGKIGGSLGADYFVFKASLSAKKEGTSKSIIKRAVELPIKPRILAKYMGEAKCCWVIEDFHKINKEEKKQMAQIMKIFMDSSVDYPDLKIIATGAVNKARDVVHLDNEMRYRVSEIEVPLMTRRELKGILDKGQELLRIEIPNEVAEQIVYYSGGLPIVIHNLAYHLCKESKILDTCMSKEYFKIPANIFYKAMQEAFSHNSDSFKSKFERATKTIDTKIKTTEILNALLDLLEKEDSASIPDIQESLKKTGKYYEINNLKSILNELCSDKRDKILSFNKEYATYYFSDPYMKAYCLYSLGKSSKKHGLNQSEAIKLIREAFILLSKRQALPVSNDELVDYVCKNYPDLTLEEIKEYVKLFREKSARKQEWDGTEGERLI
ncbi:MAG: hypothetical protein FWH23_07505 [Bacteroidales bacterium]|nr:hypothetical protein [Bacteroidales bacterium]MCL2133551.1 hypothetical protein [Bacteroidales bacterium]